MAIAVLASCTVERLTNNCMFMKDYRNSGEIISQDIDLQGFHAITIKGITSAVIRTGSNYQIKVSTDKNLMPHLESGVKDGELTLGYTCLPSSTEVTAEITLPDLDRIRNMGDARINLYDGIKADKLNLIQLGSGTIKIADAQVSNAIYAEINGSGRIDISGSCNVMEATVNGSGTIDAYGSANSLRAIMTGSGVMNLDSLSTAEARATITGSGHIRLRASNTADLNITGSGYIGCYGHPQIYKSVTGSGSVMEVDED